MTTTAGGDGTIGGTLAEHPTSKGLVFNLAVTMLEIGGAIGLFQLTRANGGGDVEAYLVGGVAPVLGAVLGWARARTSSGDSAATFAFTALSALVAVVGSTTPTVLLYKDCATTALVGVIFGASCVLMARPVMFSILQRYGTDGTHDEMAVFDRMWLTYPGFRRSMYQMSIVWAVDFTVQAALTVLIIASTSFDTAYTWDQILPILALVVAIRLTLTVGRRAQHTNGTPQGAAAHR